MAQVSGVRRVRVHDVFEGAPAERDLTTVVAGGSTYAVLETLCVDTPRVRLALADGEDAAAALRDLPGVLVRDVRLLWTVEDSDGVLSGAPAWRLTLGADEDVLPVVALLAGETSDADAADAVDVDPVVVEPVVEAAAVVDEPVVEDAAPVVAEEPVAEEAVAPVAAVAAVAAVATVVPLLEPAPDRPAPVLAVVPSATPVVPLVPVASEPVVPTVEPVVAVVEPVVDEVVAEPVEEPVVAEAVDESPFALPAEEAFPVEAVETVEEVEAVDAAEAVDEVVAVDEPVDEPTVEVDAVEAEPEPAPVEAELVEVDAVGAEAEPEAVLEDIDQVDEVEEPVESGPDPRDELFAPVAAVVAAGRPTCTGGDADGACTLPADVVWQNDQGASWACSWHWPTSMAGYPGAEVGAVHLDGAWSTWRDGDSVDLARRAADVFMDTVRDTGKPVARRLVALDTLDGLLSQLPDDMRGAVLLWAVSVTNSEWESDAVAAHSATTLAEAAAAGRAVAWPSEVYFQEKAAPAPITPTAGETEDVQEVVEEPAVDGEKLFQQGNAAAATGDMRAASRLWTEAAEKADHAGAMRALGDLYTERDELKSAEEWYGRAAFLNDATSMTRIGVIYLQKGQSDRAAEWLRRAARFGDEEAITHLQGLVPA